jgi:hypothetical protein
MTWNAIRYKTDIEFRNRRNEYSKKYKEKNKFKKQVRKNKYVSNKELEYIKSKYPFCFNNE